MPGIQRIQYIIASRNRPKPENTINWLVMRNSKDFFLTFLEIELASVYNSFQRQMYLTISTDTHLMIQIVC